MSKTPPKDILQDGEPSSNLEQIPKMSETPPKDNLQDGDPSSNLEQAADSPFTIALPEGNAMKLFVARVPRNLQPGELEGEVEKTFGVSSVKVSIQYDRNYQYGRGSILVSNPQDAEKLVKKPFQIRETNLVIEYFRRQRGARRNIDQLRVERERLLEQLAQCKRALSYYQTQTSMLRATAVIAERRMNTALANFREAFGGEELSKELKKHAPKFFLREISGAKILAVLTATHHGSITFGLEQPPRSPAIAARAVAEIERCCLSFFTFGRHSNRQDLTGAGEMSRDGGAVEKGLEVAVSLGGGRTISSTFSSSSSS
ncbi:hypothetical protein C8R46DRAFT_1027619 [Mycena filopes]|nr:hypothetical protein C8R46DRAFT_1027619 [Mycena filopes]